MPKKSQKSDRIAKLTVIFATIFCFSCIVWGVQRDIRVDAQLSGDVAALKGWREIHQANDDMQSTRITAAENTISVNTTKIAVLQNEVTTIQSDVVAINVLLSSIVWKIWAVLVAILAQLIHVIWGYSDNRRDVRDLKGPEGPRGEKGEPGKDFSSVK